jgi:prepilin-type N-terminal cleavage/methylation domain-containing protein
MTLLLSRRITHRGHRGFTLIELTVVLAVIVTLALVLTPSITNFINDARVSRARADIGSLQAAITQFYKDNGFWPQWSVANNGGPGLDTNKVDLLVSAGNIPTVASANLWTAGTPDRFEDQLVANAPGYTNRTATSTFGWNGPYISNVINADPWNNRYAANISAIDNTIGITDASNNLKNAVFILSAGANGILDTPYAQAMTVAVPGGDDISVRLQ